MNRFIPPFFMKVGMRYFRWTLFLASGHVSSLQLGNRLSLHLHTPSIAYHSCCIPPLIGVLMATTAAVLHDRTNSGSSKLQPNKIIHPAHPPHSSASFVTFQSLFR